MADHYITRPPHCVSRMAPSRKPIDVQNCIRVYNYSPELAVVQIRGKNGFHGITLTVAHLEELRRMIDAVIADNFVVKQQKVATAVKMDDPL